MNRGLELLLALSISPGKLSSPDVLDLLRRHLAYSAASSPAESCHALYLDGLRASDVSFWSVHDGETLVGCGALQEIGPAHGEIKSMHTLQEARGRGVAGFMLRYIIAEGERRGYSRISLETGSMDAYAPARALYLRHGFVECGPFGDYVEDPYSTFMELILKA